MTEYTEVEQKAIADGWKPQDELAEGVEFISAEKFVENGSFFKKISEQKKRILKLEDTVSQLNDHHTKAAEHQRKQLEKDYQSELESLKAAKVKALDAEDHEKVVEIDEQIRTTEKPVEVDNGFDNALKSFKSDNDWYDKDVEMQEDADAFGLAYNQRHPNTDPEKIFEHIVVKMKKLYPEKFENGKRNDLPSVEGGTAPRGKSGSMKDLTDDEREVFKRFDGMSVFKDDKARNQYISDVIAMRG